MSHVTLQQVHQVIVEATVGGEAGDIAIDDISFDTEPCPNTDVCDFEEEGSCGWQQQEAEVDADWVRGSGSTLNLQTGPDYDHTTYTPAGHYYYLPSAPTDLAGQRAKMASLLFPAGEGVCVQLWYHMWGKGVGTLNVYQLGEQGDQALLFSRTGNQDHTWRFAQASLQLTGQAFKIMVEGVKMGPSSEGDMAFDDVLVTGSQCPPPGHCDFQSSLCGWRNLDGGVDDGDWLRGRGASSNPNTGPSVDHTTNSSLGYYLYADSSLGEWGVRSVLVSDLLQPTSRGHCFTFWYHMHGDYVGTLKVYSNNRKLHASGDETGLLMWRETGNQGDVWLEASLSVDFDQTSWFVFEYQRGKGSGGDVALDDITVRPGPCYLEPPTPLPTTDGSLFLGLGVGLTLLLGVAIIAGLYVLHKRHSSTSDPKLIENDELDQNSGLDLLDRSIDGTNQSNCSIFDFADLGNEVSES
ncbi:MAM and LDL-receptor class A domain-containing protein 1 [Aplochiton taeniatus]